MQGVIFAVAMLGTPGIFILAAMVAFRKADRRHR